MVLFTQGSGRIVRKKDREPCNFLMDLFIKVTLKMINLVEKGPKFSLMGVNMLEISLLACFMAKVNLNKLVMDPNTTDTGGKI